MYVHRCINDIDVSVSLTVQNVSGFNYRGLARPWPCIAVMTSSSSSLRGEAGERRGAYHEVGV